MPKYTDEDIRNMSKITCKIAADYLGISPMAVSIGMRNDLLPIYHRYQRNQVFGCESNRHIVKAKVQLYRNSFSMFKPDQPCTTGESGRTV